MPQTIVPMSTNLYYGQTSTITEDIKQRLATRHRLVFLQGGPQEVLPDGAHDPFTGPADYSAFGVLAAELKAIDPTVKVGLYVGGIASPDVHYPSFDWIADADTLHRLDGTPAGTTPHSPVQPGDTRKKTINYSRAATRSMLIANWRAWLTANHLDGMLFDSWETEFYATLMATDMGCPTGALEGPVHTEEWWVQWLPLWTVELTEALESTGLECWVNGLEQPGRGVHRVPYNPSNPIHQVLGPGQVRCVEYASGSLSEGTFPQWLDPTEFAAYLTQRSQVDALGGRGMWFQQPQALDYYMTPNPYPVVPSMARFYLSGHLLGDDGSRRQYYGYNDQEAYRGWIRYGPTPPAGTRYLFDGGNDWDQDPGQPRGSVIWDATPGGVSVARREYEHAWVVANPNRAAGWFRVPGVYRDWDPETGTLCIVSADSPYLSVADGQGMLLFKQPVPVVTLWSVPMRARLMHVAQDEDGNVLPGRAVTVYKGDGVTLFDQVLYDAPSGGAVVTAPATDGLGRLTLYADLGTRVTLAIGGVLGHYDSEFSIDPEDVRQTGQPVVIDDVPGTTEYLVEMQPTAGGAAGNKAMLVLNADGTTLLALRPHGLSGVSNGLATDTALQANRLLLVDPNDPPRILGDLSAASMSRRLVIQSSVANGSSDLGIAPNGTGIRGAISVVQTSALDATTGARLFAQVGSDSVLESFGTGGAVAAALSIRPNQIEALRFRVNGDITQKVGVMANAATSGHLQIASCNGPPTGAPGAYTGLVPIVFDAPGNRLYASFGGTWRSVQFT